MGSGEPTYLNVSIGLSGLRFKSYIEGVEVKIIPFALKIKYFRHGGRQPHASVGHRSEFVFVSQMLVSALSQVCNLKTLIPPGGCLRFHLSRDEKTPKTQRHLVNFQETSEVEISLPSSRKSRPAVSYTEELNCPIRYRYCYRL